jgi:hypothetical protein
MTTPSPKLSSACPTVPSSAVWTFCSTNPSVPVRYVIAARGSA